jgi:hypothetical protein
LIKKLKAIRTATHPARFKSSQHNDNDSADSEDETQQFLDTLTLEGSAEDDHE